MRARALCLAGALACSLPGGALAAQQKGIVVEEAKAGSAAARAGIRRGDLLLAWERSASPPANPRPASGTLVSPFDIPDVEIEEAPRGPFRLSGRRGCVSRTWEVPPGDWSLTVRPLLPVPLLAAYRKGRREIAAGRLEAGLAAWRQTAMRLAARGEPEPAAWILRRSAEVQVDNGHRDAAEATYEEALRIAERCGPGVLSQLQLDLAIVLRQQGELARARDLLHPVASESLHAALVLNQIGRLSALQGDNPAAERRLVAALALRERLAPGSLVVAQALGNLGIVESHLGKLAAAEDLERRALAIDERLQPDGLEVANDLTNLGNIARAHGDLEAAVDYHRRALALRERLAPGSDAVAGALQNVAAVLFDADDPAAAAAALQRALALLERRHASDFMIAPVLMGIGSVAGGQRDYGLAKRVLRRALAIQERIAPGGLDHAVILSNLADVLLEEGQLAEAEAGCRYALRIFHELAPGTLKEATAYRELALILRRAKRLGEARDLYNRALGLLEAQWQKPDGSSQASPRSGLGHFFFYHEAVDLLVELRRPAEAFHVLERYRARGLLALLAERDLAFGADLPADLERERRSLNAEHDRLLSLLAGRSLVDAGAQEELQLQLADVRRRQDWLRERIRTASPRLAALRYPEPLDLAATANALDPGTLLLSYSVGQATSYLFAVGPGPGRFAAFRIEAGEAALGDEVRRLRTLIERGGTAGGRETALRAAAPLTSLLLAPAAGEIAAAERLLVLPDGGLHLLPFAVLADPNASGTPRFLVEAKPIHEAASATVFAELKKTRHRRSELRLAAFGDPVYPSFQAAGGAPEPALREVLRDGLRLDPLPGTRAEVEGLGRLFPQTSHVFLGAEATEERAKSLGREPSIVHFACHAFLDERSPLDSGLVLSIPERPREGQDNGLLQAWEIFEQVHLDADLVTLSTCGSALGKEVAGEGLLGLTRAFQYAGARTVLASLWSVGDAGTAELMRRFYGYLKAGETKDEALQHAQIDLLRSGTDLARPFSWAAFELVGDWR